MSCCCVSETFVISLVRCSCRVYYIGFLSADYSRRCLGNYLIALKTKYFAAAARFAYESYTSAARRRIRME